MAFILLIIVMDKNINSLINKIDDVASQLIFQGKNAGLSEDKLEMLQKQINQIQINNSEKTLSSLHLSLIQIY